MRALALVFALAALAACGGGGGGGGESDAYPEPVLVSQTIRFQELQASGFHTCGVASDGAVYCWGVNTNFALGTQAPLDVCDLGFLGLYSCTHEPQRVAGAPALTRLVLAGSLLYPHSCGLTADGSAYCWGTGQGGGLGNGRRGDGVMSSTPVAVTGGLSFATLRSSLRGGTCGVTTNQESWCWGTGRDILGQGSTTSRGDYSAPQRVEWARRFVSFG